jgi:hypothetical protein
MKKFSILTLILAFTVATPALLHAQIIKGELFAGGNLCQVDGDECYGYKKIGVHAGAGALIPLTNWMDVGLEVLFSQKGAFKRDSITYNSTYPHAYNLKLNYVEIPLMLYITDKNIVSAGVGVSYGRLVGLAELDDGQPSTYDDGVTIGTGDGNIHWRSYDPNLPDISSIDDINELNRIAYENCPSITYVSEAVANSTTYRPDDWNICADLRFRIWEGLHLEARYQYSLRPLRYRMYYSDPNQTIPNQIRKQYNNAITVRLVYIFNEHRSKANLEATKK